jgi:hypothetical protein
MGTTEHQVQENETLQCIAEQSGYRSVDPLLAANPALESTVEANLDVLQPGMTVLVPDPVAGFNQGATDKQHVYVLPRQKKDLVLTVQSPDGVKLSDCQYELSWNPPPNSSSNGKPRSSVQGQLVGGSFRVEDWPIAVTEASLKVTLQYNKRVEEAVSETYGAGGGSVYHVENIKLYVGGLDPLIGSDADRGKAVQKILTNLGFLDLGPQEIDGNLASDRSRAAIHKFQYLQKIKPKTKALIDQETVSRLLQEQQNKIASSGTPFQHQAKDRDRPLPFGADANATEERVTTAFSGYLEPNAVVQRREEDGKTSPNRQKFGKMQYFPKQAYVAPCDPGATNNPNVIRMKTRRFIFLDSGYWMSKARDFSVIWGRHVYRCEFKRDGGGSHAYNYSGDTERLDLKFFNGMYGRAKVIQIATASWAPEYEFDWSKLIVVIPDIHLMTGENGNIFHGKFLLDPELDLLDFAKRLVDIYGLTGKVQVIQLGDSYDLWVGCEPRYFVKNESVLVEMMRDVDQRWNCGAARCPGQHRTPSEVCQIGPMRPAPSDARTFGFDCGRRNPWCYGHLKPGEVCQAYPDIWGPEVQHWTCGSISPPCPEEHLTRAKGRDNWSDPTGVCKNGTWKCSKTEPLCTGHEERLATCPDHIDAIDEVRRWIQDIQGVGSDWVQELLRRMDLHKKLPSGLTLDKLASDLSTNVGGAVRWLNPAERALRLLAEQCELTYIHGNHDNYLRLGPVTSRAGLSKRSEHGVWETDGILIEHGHRLEAVLILSGDKPVHFPTNYDGSTSGYETTNKYYHSHKAELEGRFGRLDWLSRLAIYMGPESEDDGNDFWITGANLWAQNTQQNQYWGEHAEVWVGRQSLKTQYKPPHVFVIGHTHMPMLAYINIDFFS